MTENGEGTLSGSSSSVSPAVLEILSSILPNPQPASSRNLPKFIDHGESSTENDEESNEIPSTSGQNHQGPSHVIANSFPNISSRNNEREYQVYRAVGGGHINSTSALTTEPFLKEQKSSTTSAKIPPSYSSVLKLGPPKPREEDLLPSVSFVTRQPPPSYAEVQGIWQDSPSIISSDSRIFGPDPAYMVCPRCRTVVVTDVERERSIWTYFASILMCLLCCWPCCLLPYWTDTFQYSYHTCPNCSHYFGMYRPC